MPKNVTRIAVMAALLAALVPATAKATHCRDLIILSGDPTVTTPYRVGGQNLGVAGCLAVHASTNKITPGATDAWASISTVAQPTAPSGGTLKVGTGTPTALTWTLNSVRNRWESQTIAIGSTGTVVSTLTGISFPCTGCGASQTVTYTR